MSDLEAPPTGWWWNTDVSMSDLDQMFTKNKGRRPQGKPAAPLQINLSESSA
jgi:hypothetical protein